MAKNPADDSAYERLRHDIVRMCNIESLIEELRKICDNDAKYIAAEMQRLEALGYDMEISVTIHIDAVPMMLNELGLEKTYR